MAAKFGENYVLANEMIETEDAVNAIEDVENQEVIDLKKKKIIKKQEVIIEKPNEDEEVIVLKKKKIVHKKSQV